VSELKQAEAASDTLESLCEKILSKAFEDWAELIEAPIEVNGLSAATLETDAQLDSSAMLLKTSVEGDWNGTVQLLFPPKFVLTLAGKKRELPDSAVEQKLSSGPDDDDLVVFAELANLLCRSSNSVFESLDKNVRFSLDPDQLQTRYVAQADGPEHIPAGPTVWVCVPAQLGESVYQIRFLLPPELVESLYPDSKLLAIAPAAAESTDVSTKTEGDATETESESDADTQSEQRGELADGEVVSPDAMQGVSVVVLDSSRRTALLMKRSLDRFGATVSVCTDSKAANRVLRENEVHLLLIEEGVKGWQRTTVVCRKGSRGKVAIVLVASHLTRKKVIEAVKYGVMRILVKTFPVSTLLREIQHALRRAGRDDQAELVPSSEQVIGLMAEQPDGTAVLKHLQKLETAKAMPQVAERVLGITADDKSGAVELERMITADTNITAVVLKRANSSFYSAVRKVTQVRDAIVRVGFDSVKQIVLALSVMNMISHDQQQLGFDRGKFWQASLATAVLCEKIASSLGLTEKSGAYTTGMLADFGCLVLDDCFAEHFEKAICLVHEHKIPLAEAERRVLGIDHAQVTSFILDRWKLPQQMVEVLKYQESSDQLMGLDENRVMAAVVYLSRWLVLGLGIGDKSEVIFDYCPPELLELVDVKDLLTDEFLDELVQEVNEMLSNFKSRCDWPFVVEPVRPEIYYFEECAPRISAVEMLIRRLGSSPVLLGSLAELRDRPVEDVAILQFDSAESLKQAAEGEDWGNRPFLFVLPRGEVVKDAIVRKTVGLPTGRCQYVDYPFCIRDFSSCVVNLGS